MIYKNQNIIYIFLFIGIFLYSLFFFSETYAQGTDAGSPFLGFDTSSPCNYWQSIFNFGILAAGILAVTMLIFGGIYYMTAMGQEERIKNAKSVMAGAVVGFILAISSWLIFKVIAPDLLQCELNIPSVTLPRTNNNTSENNNTSGSINSSSDPCAGVSDDDLFDSEEDCNNGWDGACRQVPNGDNNQDNDSSSRGSGRPCNNDDDCLNEEERCIGAEEEAGTTGTCTVSESPEDNDNGRTGRWCRLGGGTWADVSRLIEEGRITANPGPRRDIEDGLGNRTCRWMSSGSSCSSSNPCDGQPLEIPLDERIASLLVSLVEQGGFTPHVSNVVQGHGRCRRCQNPNTQYPCNRDSSHWHGAALDLQTNDDIQRYIAENIQVDSLYGPLGLPDSERSQRQGQNCSSERFTSPYFVNNGHVGATISGGTACTHRQHIHVDYNFN